MTIIKNITNFLDFISSNIEIEDDNICDRSCSFLEMIDDLYWDCPFSDKSDEMGEFDNPKRCKFCKDTFDKGE
jgi:hypothetical protein